VIYTAITYYSTVARQEFASIDAATTWASSFGSAIAGCLVFDEYGRAVAHHRSTPDPATWEAVHVGNLPGDHRELSSAKQRRYLVDLLLALDSKPTVCCICADVNFVRGMAIRSVIVDATAARVNVATHETISRLIDAYKSGDSFGVENLYLDVAEVLRITDHSAALAIINDPYLGIVTMPRTVPSAAARPSPVLPPRATETFRSFLVAFGARRGPDGRTIPGESRTVEGAQ
jgi:hypothetical protein